MRRPFGPSFLSKDSLSVRLNLANFAHVGGAGRRPRRAARLRRGAVLGRARGRGPRDRRPPGPRRRLLGENQNKS